MQQVVLLQTDLVDSTRLMESLGDEAGARFRAQHNVAARDLLAHHGGHELERSDGFLLTFGTVDDAVAYAIDYHDTLSRLTPATLARAGIHVGTLEYRNNLDSHVRLGAKAVEADGISIATTARIASLAIGRQTLLSAAAKNALVRTPHRTLCHGHWLFKGIEEPLEIHEIGPGDAPFRTPQDATKGHAVVHRNGRWLPRSAIPHSLPVERNVFVGRTTSIEAVRHHLQGDARLITIVGPGGVGKTRFVQHFGWQHLGQFSGGVYFCDLSQATTLDGICGAVAQGLDIPLGRDNPVEQIGNALAGRFESLIVLDNFEQVASFAMQTLGHWLDRTLHARFLVTTRSILGLDGEEVVRLSTLDAADSKQLFSLRASAYGGDSHRGIDDERLLQALVTMLDGLPLAIELAAVRMRVFDLETLVARMRDRFAVLTSSGGRPSRQSTLRATLDWSWDLLSPPEQAVAARLSVFEGGFALGAAEAVAQGTDGDASMVAEHLQSLVEKSWVQRSDARRFRLLGSMQEYLGHRLVESTPRTSDEDARPFADAEERHWNHFGSLDWSRPAPALVDDIDNLVAATRRATSAPQARAAADVLMVTWAALKLCGPYRTGVDLADAVLRLDRLTDMERAKAHFVKGSALHLLGRYPAAREDYRMSLAAAQQGRHASIEARVLCSLAESHTDVGDFHEARPLLDRSRTIAASVDDQVLLCAVLNAIGTTEEAQGNHDQAITTFRQALEQANAIEDSRWICGVLGNLGSSLHQCGRLDEAETSYGDALRLAVATGDRRWEGNIRCNLGLLLGEHGRHDEGIELLRAAEALATALGHVRLALISAWNLGIVSEARGDHGDASANYRRARATAESVKDKAAYEQLDAVCRRLAVD